MEGFVPYCELEEEEEEEEATAIDVPGGYYLRTVDS